jgi:hypothetical protein
VVQEGLTNAHRHAPGAQVSVTLRHESDALVVEVVNGPSARPPSRALRGSGTGLVGLAERVRLAGGVLHSGPTPPAPTRCSPTTSSGWAARPRPAAGASTTGVPLLLLGGPARGEDHVRGGFDALGELPPDRIDQNV